VGEVQVFDEQNLYSLVNGQADAFFAYAFEEVAVGTYGDEQGSSLRVEIWQLGTPADAYGLFTTVRAGEPVAVGNDGDGEPGRRLDFWQDRYFVRLFAVAPVDASVLLSFAEQVADSVPEGGERPPLVAGLPQDGLVERGDLFFHEEISVQDVLWLGGQNLLMLGPETDAVLARYEAGGKGAWLLVVQYTDPGAVEAAREALQLSGMANLVATEANGSFLAAVFGHATPAVAQSMLTEALEMERE
jgi:hypothetical protein